MSFDFRPTLNGLNLMIRPLEENDRDSLYDTASDPLIWEQHPSNRHNRDEFNEFFTESLLSGGALTVIDKCSDKIIGSSRFHGYNKNNRSVEIGWTFLARAYWGGKYNGELKQLMINHAFKFVETVIFYVDSSNIRSQISVEKIGGRRDNDLDNQGRVIYRINKSEYLKSKSISTTSLSNMA